MFHKEISEDHQKLWNASFRGNTMEVRRLLVSGRMLDVNHGAGKNPTPIANAAYRGDKEMVQVLLDHGADVEKTGINGVTALHCAAEYGSLELVKLLLDGGAELNRKTLISGLTPLHHACMHVFHSEKLGISLGGKDHLEVIKLLLDRGANPTLKDKFGKTPLDSVDVEMHQEVTKIMTEGGWL